MKITTIMTKRELMELDLMNIDKWYGEKDINDFECFSLASVVGVDIGADIDVITTENKCLGAAVLMYPDYFERLANNKDADLIIIPSSIEEVLVIRCGDINLNRKLLESTINDINAAEVPFDIRLGDIPLFYEKGSYKITKM